MIGAVMQPYFFPYIGYYQLAFASDVFVFLDNVNYIRRGFVNRNSICANGRRIDFSIPVSKASQNRFISEHNYVGEFGGFIQLLRRSYLKSPNFKEVMDLVEGIVLDPENNVAKKNSKTLIGIMNYLGIERKYFYSSEINLREDFKGQDRILEICGNVGITDYRNAPGGKELYSDAEFLKKGINIKFVRPNSISYSQGGFDFISNASIIDVLMNCQKSQVVQMLSEYTLESH